MYGHYNYGVVDLGVVIIAEIFIILKYDALIKPRQNNFREDKQIW